MLVGVADENSPAFKARESSRSPSPRTADCRRRRRGRRRRGRDWRPAAQGRSRHCLRGFRWARLTRLASCEASRSSFRSSLRPVRLTANSKPPRSSILRRPGSNVSVRVAIADEGDAVAGSIAQGLDDGRPKHGVRETNRGAVGGVNPVRATGAGHADVVAPRLQMSADQEVVACPARRVRCPARLRDR